MNDITVDIGICTFRREQVALTLRSLAEMELPANCSLRIIVADNDTTPSAQVLVASTTAALKLSVVYLHAPEANISIARNICLDAAIAEYLGFIDDDEIVGVGWLNAMLTRLQEAKADAVLGPVRAIYPDNAPEWLRRGEFHSTKPEYVHGKIVTGYAGNVLMRRTSPAFTNLRFRLDLGVSGGEDTDFFMRAYQAGACIEYAPDAIVFEGVPFERANLAWLKRRRYRFGETHAMLLLATNPSPLKRRLILVATIAKVVCCYLMIPVSVFDSVKRRYWFLRGTFHLAAVRTLMKQ